MSPEGKALIREYNQRMVALREERERLARTQPHKVRVHDARMVAYTNEVKKRLKELV